MWKTSPHILLVVECLHGTAVWLLKTACASLDDVPNILSGVAELAAGDTGTQAEVADTDRVVLELIRKGVVSLGHGTDKDTDALFLTKV